MRILHIDAGREMRGGQWQVLRLAEGLKAAGVEVRLAAPAGSPLFGKAAAAGIDTRPLSIAAAREPADLVHAHDARAHALAAVVGRRPLVVSRRVAFPIGTDLVSRWKYGRAAYYIAVSQFVRHTLAERGVPAERISVVYDGVPLLEPAAGDGRILAPPPAPDKPAELYRRAGIEISFAQDLETDLRTASIFVYLSASEGLGSGVLLAMSAGVPVIASKTGGLAEIIHHGDNGLLVDNTPESLAAAVRRLRDDPAFAGQLAARGRQTVAEKFTIDNMVRDTLAVYNRVV